MARTQQSPQDSRTRIRRAEAALRAEVRLGEHAVRMNLLRQHAKRVLRARLCSLKASMQSACRSIGYYNLHPRDDPSGDSHFTHLNAQRRKLINGGEDAILVEHGVSVHVPIGDGTATALLTKAVCAACGASLVHFDPKEHDIEREQLACLACGGMFDLDMIYD